MKYNGISHIFSIARSDKAYHILGFSHKSVIIYIAPFIRLEIGGTMPVGIIACAFGQQRTYVAGPSNEAIGRVALAIRQRTDGIIATQWEIQACLQAVNKSADELVSFYHDDNSHYLSTEQVFMRSLAYFKAAGISEVVIVAQPLHLLVIRCAMKQWQIDPSFHFTHAYDRLMRQIPFDTSAGNTQWWTRGPIRFTLYLIRAALLGLHGH